MEYRSTNDNGYSHFRGDVVTNVSSGQAINSSHGVRLTGGSTGGIIESAGDETNIALTVRAKGSGPLNFGAATSPVTILSSNLLIGSTGSLGLQATSTGTVTLGSTNSTIFISGSTAPFSGFLRMVDTAVATPNFATTNIMVMETTHTFVGLTTNYFLIAQPQNLSTDCLLSQTFIGSTAGEIHCRFIKASTVTVAASTATISFLAIRM